MPETTINRHFLYPSIQEAVCHEGSKASRAIFLKNGLVFTTGFSKVSERQFSLREPGLLNEPKIETEVDTSNGVMFPFYDADTNMVYLCGKVLSNSTKFYCFPFIFITFLKCRATRLFATLR
jgi:hypothetical protein